MKTLNKDDIIRICTQPYETMNVEIKNLLTPEIEKLALHYGSMQAAEAKGNPIITGQRAFIEGIYVGLKLAEQDGTNLKLVYKEKL